MIQKDKTYLWEKKPVKVIGVHENGIVTIKTSSGTFNIDADELDEFTITDFKELYKTALKKLNTMTDEELIIFINS